MINYWVLSENDCQETKNYLYLARIEKHTAEIDKFLYALYYVLARHD